MDLIAVRAALNREPDFLTHLLEDITEELADEAGLDLAAALITYVEEEVARVNPISADIE